MAIAKHFKLNTGADIPAVGLGKREPLLTLRWSLLTRSQALGDLNLVRYAKQSLSPSETGITISMLHCKIHLPFAASYTR